MYRMEQARQYKKTYLTASQKVGSQSAMSEKNKEFEEHIKRESHDPYVITTVTKADMSPQGSFGLTLVKSV